MAITRYIERLRKYRAVVNIRDNPEEFAAEKSAPTRLRITISHPPPPFFKRKKEKTEEKTEKREKQKSDTSVALQRRCRDLGESCRVPAASRESNVIKRLASIRREHSDIELPSSLRARFMLAEKAGRKENEKMGFKACTVRRYFFIWQS